MTHELNLVEMTDGLISALAEAGLPPVASIITKGLARTFCHRFSDSDRAACTAQIEVIVRQRVAHYWLHHQTEIVQEKVSTWTED